MSDQTITILVGVAMLTGLLGTVIPWFPDLLLIWGAALAYGLFVGWGTGGAVLFGLMTVLALAGLAAEVALTAAGARVGGASGWGIAAGVVLGLIGLVLFSPVGALVGLAFGLLAVEGYRHRNLREGARATAGALLGWTASFAAKFGLALAMVVLWGVWVAVG